MSTREQRKEIFNETYLHCIKDPELKAAIADSLKKTRVYYENDYPFFPAKEHFDTEVIVSGKRSFQAVMDLKRELPESKVAVLNFANAFHPGGGVNSGASAQEECLCRCSTLYPLLDNRFTKEKYYDFHNKCGDAKATDAVIYTPDVVIFKTDTDLPEMMDREDWVTVDVMTCAAPDLRDEANIYSLLAGDGAKMNSAELFGFHVRRAIHLMTVAASKKADILVLGAFGCGAFQNDPKVVARAYKAALQEFDGVFRRIEFAVYCSQRDSENYTVFGGVLG